MGVRAGHDSLVETTSGVAINIAVAFVNDSLERVSLPAHNEVTMVHRTSRVAVREAIGKGP